MTYRIAFTGNILPDFDRINVQTQTKVLLKLSNDEVLKFFNKNKVVLKKNLSLENATALQQKLQNIGLEICIESEASITPIMPNHETIPLDYQEETTEEITQPPKPKHQKFQEDTMGVNHLHDIEYTTLKSKKFTLFVSGRLNRLGFVNQITLIFLSLIIPIIAALPFNSSFLLGNADYQSSNLLQNIITIYSIIILLYYARIVILRLHDCNLAGYCSLLYLTFPIPYIGKLIAILATLFLCVYPGQHQANIYGKNPKPTLAIGVIILTVATILILISNKLF